MKRCIRSVCLVVTAILASLDASGAVFAVDLPGHCR